MDSDKKTKEIKITEKDILECKKMSDIEKFRHMFEKLNDQYSVKNLMKNLSVK